MCMPHTTLCLQHGSQTNRARNKLHCVDRSELLQHLTANIQHLVLPWNVLLALIMSQKAARIGTETRAQQTRTGTSSGVENPAGKLRCCPPICISVEICRF